MPQYVVTKTVKTASLRDIIVKVLYNSPRDGRLNE